MSSVDILILQINTLETHPVLFKQKLEWEEGESSIICMQLHRATLLAQEQTLGY